MRLAWLAVLILAVIASFACGQDSNSCDIERFETYTDALDIAKQQERPMLILLTAKWCPACKLFAKDVLRPMRDAGELKPLVYFELDIDDYPTESRSLMEGNRIPQLVIYDLKNARLYSRKESQVKSKVQQFIEPFKKTERDWWK